jgi:small conductance mechanosensitive channel
MQLMGNFRISIQLKSIFLFVFCLKCPLAWEDSMDIDLSNAWKSGSRIIDLAISLLPNAILAIVIFIFFLILASAAKSIVRRASRRRERRQNLGLLLGQLAQVTLVVLGFLIAFSIVAPSFHASDLIKMLGIGSVAIGFAFQNILQNFLAGILILIHEPYKLGDFITVNGLEGMVEDIETRATVISTADGHRVVIPNAVLFTNPVVVRNKDNKQGLETDEAESVSVRH